MDRSSRDFEIRWENAHKDSNEDLQMQYLPESNNFEEHVL